jgi:hypothetical protein
MKRLGFLAKVAAGATGTYLAWTAYDKYTLEGLPWEWNEHREKGFAGAREKFISLPTRDHQISRLKSSEEYDILVIGGGATGSGTALVS